MLSKLLEELGKRLITAVEARSYGSVLLAVLFVVGSAFLLLQYLHSTPSALETLRSTSFLFITAVAIGVGATVAMKQAGNIPHVVAIVGLFVYTSAAATAIWYLTRDETPVFKIDVILDETVDLGPSLLAAFLQAVHQPHIQLTLLNRRLVPVDGLSIMNFERAEAAAVPQMRQPPVSTHTVLVTKKMLAEAQWANLFYAIRGHFGIVSLYGVVEPTAGSGDVLARKYLASMVPLAALHMAAMERGLSFLPDRLPETEHGCLHDFSVDRLLLIEKLRQGPELCATEITGLNMVFGPSITNEYKNILEHSRRLKNEP
jgi:hypothetical protein